MAFRIDTSGHPRTGGVWKQRFGQPGDAAAAIAAPLRGVLEPDEQVRGARGRGIGGGRQPRVFGQWACCVFRQAAHQFGSGHGQAQKVVDLILRSAFHGLS